MRNVVIIIAVIFLILLAVVFINYREAAKLAAIRTFDDCKNAGYPVMESFPERCMTPDGRSFTADASPQEIYITGTITCLPHRDQEGPQTLECAYGLKTDDGIYYALSDSDPDYGNLTKAGTGDRVVINGIFRPSDKGNYQSAGEITIENISVE